jgi:hypothetical protein
VAAAADCDGGADNERWAPPASDMSAMGASDTAGGRGAGARGTEFSRGDEVRG